MEGPRQAGLPKTVSGLAQAEQLQSCFKSQVVDTCVPKGLGASGCKQERVGSVASPLGIIQYTSRPKLHCGQVLQCVCPIKKPLGKGRGTIIQGLHRLSLLYVYSKGTEVKQSPRVGLVVLCLTRTIYYHAPRAPFTAFH